MKAARKHSPFKESTALFLKSYLKILVLLILLGCSIATAQPRLKPLPPDSPFKFAVLGDNRGDSYGNQFPVFYKILREINSANAAFVFNTGDLINGYAGDEEAILRRQWEGYKKAVANLKMPIFNVPGNHDVFDSMSARLWKLYQGEPYYSFDYGSARFIALDTETQPGQLSPKQFRWLENQLEEAGNRHVFLFLHKPLFPVDGHVGTSLDAYPRERDRLHALFVKHRKSIKGVFQGHEHLYNFEERDGIPYYITGGGGAELYVPPELGGFYHYLLVQVDSGKVATSVERIGIVPSAIKKSRYITPNTLIEELEHSLFWYTWKQPASKEATKESASDGTQGLKVWFDTSLSEWSVLYAPIQTPLDLSRYNALSWDVFVPRKLNKRIQTVLVINEKYESQLIILKSGWNRITIPLDSLKMPEEVLRSGAKQLQWNLSPTNKNLAGWVVFDNLRAHYVDPKSKKNIFAGEVQSTQRRKPDQLNQLLESWEGNLLWGASDETVRSEPAAGKEFQNKKALKISFDFSKYKRPAIFASLNEPWNLSGVSELTADIYAPQPVGGKLWISFAVADGTTRYKAPLQLLRPGWNKMIVDLNSDWLPVNAQRVVRQIELHFSTETAGLSGWVAFDDLRAGKRRQTTANSGAFKQR